jgi:hypothetical protein
MPQHCPFFVNTLMCVQIFSEHTRAEDVGVVITLLRFSLETTLVVIWACLKRLEFIVNSFSHCIPVVIF